MNSIRKGFTLIELIVALGITALFGYFFISIGRDFLEAWEHVGDSVARETEARAALDQIERDFEAALFREGGDVMFAVDVLGDGSNAFGKWQGGLAERPAGSGFDTTINQYGWAGSWVRMITAAPSLNAVGYQIVRSTIKDGVGTPRYMLYRNVELLKNTLGNGLDLRAPAYIDNGYIGIFQRPNIVAVNVVDFGVRLYVYDSGDPSGPDAPDGLRLIFPADGASRLLSPISAVDGYRSSTFLASNYTNRYPDVVEVFLRVLNEQGADELSRIEAEGSNQLWEEIVAKHSQLYRRFIRIQGEGGA